MKIVENGLSSLHWRVYNFLKSSCIGKENAISMNSLSDVFMVSGRDIRQIIKDISEYSIINTIIATSSKGYYIPKNEIEAKEANIMLKKRLESSIKRYISNSLDDVNWLFNYVKSLKEEYEKAPQAQTVLQFNGYEKDVNYFGERVNQKAYTDLFEI